MLPGDKVKVEGWQAIPSFNGQIGTVRNWREVGLQAQNISYEYLVEFDPIEPFSWPRGPYVWIPARFVKAVMDA